MKRLIAMLTLLSLCGCIPIGFRSSTQSLLPSAARDTLLQGFGLRRTRAPDQQPRFDTRDRIIEQ